MVRDLVRSLCVMAAVVCGSGQAAAVERLGDFSFRDLLQTVQARQALADDPSLAALNLGVEVKGGVAFLWGPVPTVALSFRAEARLRALIQLIDVRNQLEITPDLLFPLPIPAPQRVLPDRLPPPLPVVPRPPLGVPGRDAKRDLVYA